jgi:hypothetical protein
MALHLVVITSACLAVITTALAMAAGHAAHGVTMRSAGQSALPSAALSAGHRPAMALVAWYSGTGSRPSHAVRVPRAISITSAVCVPRVTVSRGSASAFTNPSRAEPRRWRVRAL